MKPWMISSLIIAGLLLCSVATFAQTDETLTLPAPVLVTAAGQSADMLMINLLCRKAGIPTAHNNLATPDTIQALISGVIQMPVSARRYGPIQSIIIVPGGSTKGLGAAKIDEAWEMNRVQELIKYANDNDMPIMVCHMGGESRRGSLSDPFNRLAAEAADVIIVTKEGNADGFFTDIATDKAIPIYEVEDLPAIEGVLAQLYVYE
jgi:hypothetical protein